MNYQISCQNPSSNYLQVEINIETKGETETELQLPSWRPGRYQIQNFAKNVRSFEVKNEKSELLPFKKITKDRWTISTANSERLTVTYEYYANQQDAGGSYVDKYILYVNPINLCMYRPGDEENPRTLTVYYPKNKKVCCGIPYTRSDDAIKFQASSFHQLVDAPFIISNTLKQKTYLVNEIPFHFWVQGKIEVDWELILKDFKKFTAAQIDLFGEFPESSYHFILWVLPHAYYHGVEHYNSTMMVLGPDSQNFGDMYNDLLGLASHELYHTWNVKKLRPKELSPYKYDRENYFETCFIAEGITTFYGDWMLYRSGVLSKDQYQKELETTLKRHFDFADKSTCSLLESSFDLWIDGYEQGAPRRKVSVYHKGAIAALLLNHKLKALVKHPYPLDLVMNKMWAEHGTNMKGYTYLDYQNIVEEIAGESMKAYFDKVIEGNESLFDITAEAVAAMGFKLSKNSKSQVSLNKI